MKEKVKIMDDMLMKVLLTISNEQTEIHYCAYGKTVNVIPTEDSAEMFIRVLFALQEAKGEDETYKDFVLERTDDDPTKEAIIEELHQYAEKSPVETPMQDWLIMAIIEAQRKQHSTNQLMTIDCDSLVEQYRGKKTSKKQKKEYFTYAKAILGYLRNIRIKAITSEGTASINALNCLRYDENTHIIEVGFGSALDKHIKEMSKQAFEGGK